MGARVQRVSLKRVGGEMVARSGFPRSPTSAARPRQSLSDTFACPRGQRTHSDESAEAHDSVAALAERRLARVAVMRRSERQDCAQ